MKYEPKTYEIEAFRFGIDQFPKWFIEAIDNGDVVLHGIPEAYQYCEIDVHDCGTWPIANYGDYVVRYADGSIYPIKHELFEQCYEEYKMSERSKPALRDSYYYLDSEFDVLSDVYVGDRVGESLISIGNCFRTAEEAEAAAEKIKELLLGLHENDENLQEKPLPKLTAEVFVRPDCPDWARYAAVDEDGMAVLFEHRPTIASTGKWWDRRCRYCPLDGLYDASDWKNSLIEHPAKPRPKLTTEVFDREDCPEWARYAAVDKNGDAYYFRQKPYINAAKNAWIYESIEKGCWVFIDHNWDSSDWQNSLIERPAKKPELPEWCNVGEWIYDKYFHEYIKVVERTQSSFKGKDSDGVEHYGDFNFEVIVPAHYRPYEAEEMYELLGKHIEDAEEVMLVTIFYKKDNLVKAGAKYYDAERLFNECTINGNPCGKLVHLNEKGEWVE